MIAGFIIVTGLAIIAMCAFRMSVFNAALQ